MNTHRAKVVLLCIKIFLSLAFNFFFNSLYYKDQDCAVLNSQKELSYLFGSTLKIGGLVLQVIGTCNHETKNRKLNCPLCNCKDNIMLTSPSSYFPSSPSHFLAKLSVSLFVMTMSVCFWLFFNFWQSFTISLICAIHAYFFLYDGNAYYYGFFYLFLLLLKLLWLFETKIPAGTLSETFKSGRALRVASFVMLLIFLSLKWLSLDRFSEWSYHPDENLKLSQAHALSQGSFQAEKINHPLLTIRIPVVLARYFDLRDFENFFRVIQTVWVFFGCVGVSLIGFLLAGLHGFCLSFILSLSSSLLFVTGSYLKEDSGLFFATSWAYFFLFLWLQNRSSLLMLASLFFSIVSFCFKYTGLLNIGVILALFCAKSWSLRPIFFFFFMSALVIPVLFPESIKYFSAFINGLRFEYLRGMNEHHGFYLKGLEFFFLYGFYRTFFVYENVLFGLIAMLSLYNLMSKRHLLLFALFLIYYLPFEISSGKPPPQPERYYLLTYTFLLPAICLLRWNSFKLALLLGHVLWNLITLTLIILQPTEKKLSDFVCNTKASLIIHTGYVPKITCDKLLYHLHLSNVYAQKLDTLPNEPSVLITSRAHLYRYKDYRLRRRQRKMKCFYGRLICQANFPFTVGSRFTERGYLNNVYFVSPPIYNFSELVGKIRKICFR